MHSAKIKTHFSPYILSENQEMSKIMTIFHNTLFLRKIKQLLACWTCLENQPKHLSVCKGVRPLQPKQHGPRWKQSEPSRLQSALPLAEWRLNFGEHQNHLGAYYLECGFPDATPIRDSVGLGCRPESSFLTTQKWFFGSTLGTSTLLRAFFVVVNSGFSVQQRERDFVSSHHCPSSSNCTFSPLNGTNCQTPCPFPHRQAAGLAAQLSFHVWLPCVSLGSVVSSLAKTKPQRMVTG